MYLYEDARSNKAESQYESSQMASMRVAKLSDLHVGLFSA